MSYFSLSMFGLLVVYQQQNQNSFHFEVTEYKFDCSFQANWRNLLKNVLDGT